MNSSDSISVIFPGVFECILSNSHRRLFRDQFYTLYNTIYNLKSKLEGDKSFHALPYNKISAYLVQTESICNTTKISAT